MRLLAVYDDPTWASKTIESLRFTARVFLRNSEGQYAFLSIVGEDGLGERHHLETCGGGVEEGETFLEAAHREVMEELGAIASNYTCIGAIIDRLNPIKRLTCSVFFSADLVQIVPETHRTEEEKILIEEVIWLNPTQAIERLKKAASPIDAFVHRRDLTAFLTLLSDDEDRT